MARFGTAARHAPGKPAKTTAPCARASLSWLRGRLAPRTPIARPCITFVELTLKMIEVGEIEEEYGYGSKHHSLGPKCSSSDPIHSPVGKRY